MPSLPKNVKEKGYFAAPGILPCTDKLPRTALTEWLEIHSPTGFYTTFDETPDGEKFTKTRRLTNTSKTNFDWLVAELKRFRDSAPKGVGYDIVYSECGNFACIVKKTKKHPPHEPTNMV